MKNPISQDPEASNRVFRGGSWNYNARFARVSERNGVSASYCDRDLGFRIFRTKEKS